jgi:hypothetical protein
VRYLTSTNPELEQLVRLTPRGMAHWASTGPINTTCGECAHLGAIGVGKKTKRNRCLKFFDMMRETVGGFVPDSTPACRHFEEKLDGAA